MTKTMKFSTAPINGQAGLRAEFFANTDLTEPPLLIRTESHIDFGGAPAQILPDHTLSDRFTGYYSPARSGLYDVFVESSGEDGGFYRLYVDGQLVFDNWSVNTALMNPISLQFEATSHKFVLEHHGCSHWLGAKLRLGIFPHDDVIDQEAKLLAAKADVVIVAVGFDPETESEGADRTFRLPPGQEQLIQEMAAANKNVVVVITAGGATDMNHWIDRVPAVLQVWYPGQEGGTALAEILF